MLADLEQARLRLSKNTDSRKKSQFGQFLTPAATAAFMAELFPTAGGVCRLLDAGAGIGSLSAAFLERWRSGGLQFERVELDAFEIDDSLHPLLEETLGRFRCDALHVDIRAGDFLHAATEELSGGLFSRSTVHYSHAILNPPYRKIGSASAHRLALRQVGIETVNLYSAFVALAVAKATLGGQIVAIIPRSFCNGPYYRPFREFLLNNAAIRHLHLFESRSKAFRDDAVLQENIIIRLERGGTPGPIRVSTSADDSFSDLAIHDYPFEQIVLPEDAELFIHIPSSPQRRAFTSPAIRHDLDALGVKVSTGPVVDFRLREHLRAVPEPGTVPLLYPGHFSGRRTRWPIEGSKKPNAIKRNAETEKWLYPSGFYCVVRRFSSKEEARRIVASVVEPGALGEASAIGFENHLNVFHQNKGGLPEAMAHGLAAFLNTTAVDEAFRRFNGHTQVNATDLKNMKYPSRDLLTRVGEWAMQEAELTQHSIDECFGAIAE